MQICNNAHILKIFVGLKRIYSIRLFTCLNELWNFVNKLSVCIGHIGSTVEHEKSYFNPQNMGSKNNLFTME